MTSEPRVRRVYDAREAGDGLRVLVDRVWPRGLTKAAADLDEWLRDIAPSTDLRRWFGHDPDRFGEFEQRYRAELADADHHDALMHLQSLTSGQVTLLTATKDLEISHATVLAQVATEAAGKAPAHHRPGRTERRG